MNQRQRILLGCGLTATFLLGVGVGVTGQIEHQKEVRAHEQQEISSCTKTFRSEGP